MRKFWVSLLAVLVALALAVPTFALELKYGGMYRWRIHAQENMSDANSDLDDTNNWIDQRLRMWFAFVGSENLRLMTHWEADTIWGMERWYAGMPGRHGGGDVGADATNLEMKNVYLEFAIPNTPAKATVGVQGLTLGKGMIFSDDASAFVINTALDPVKVRLGYIAALNSSVTTDYNDMDDFFLELKYAEGPLALEGVLFYQYGHDSDFGYPNRINYTADYPSVRPTVDKESNHLLDLGFGASYKMDWLGVSLYFVKNFGGYDIARTDEDEKYKGWALEGNIDFFMSPFTLSLGGFVFSDKYTHVAGRSYYWSEIAGLGTLDVNVAGFDYNPLPSYGPGGGPLNRGDYDLGDAPRNIWALRLGGAWQALETTKVTLNYYYLGTYKKVVSDRLTGEKDDTLGHELNLYIDQKVVDGLELRLVGAYLITDDSFTTNPDEDNIYEVGAQLLWKF